MQDAVQLLLLPSHDYILKPSEALLNPLEPSGFLVYPAPDCAHRRSLKLLQQIRSLLYKTVGSLLDDERNVPPSITLPVELVQQFLDICDTFDSLYLHGTETRKVLQLPTAARLRSILHNSRIVEGFLDEMDDQEESEEDADQGENEMSNNV